LQPIRRKLFHAAAVLQRNAGNRSTTGADSACTAPRDRYLKAAGNVIHDILV